MKTSTFCAGLILAATALLIPLSASAQTMFGYQVLVDADADSATGCSVTPTGGATMAGFEHRLLIDVEVTSGSAEVISLERQDCSGGAFQSPIAVTSPASPPWPVGLDLGVGGADAVEAGVLREAVGAAFSPFIRLAFVADDGEGSDVLATTDGSASGEPIVLGLPLDPVQIPLFSLWGIVLLLLAVIVLGWLAQRKLGRIGAMSVVLLVAGLAWAMNFMLDGAVNDWTGVPPIGQDPTGDATDGSLGNELIAGFAAFENGALYFRIDVADVENQAPDAADDDYSTDEDTPLNIAAPGVLANDSDADGDPITSVLDAGPSNAASFLLNPDGSFDYTPNADFNGSDSFTYFANDGQADSAAATVSITVNAVNDLPVALDDNGATQEDQQVDIDVLANDSDIDGNLDPSAVTVTSGPANGTTSVNPANGVITYTKATDFNGADSFDYQVCDDGTPLPALCATATVSITIDPVNDAPSFTAGNPPAVDEDAGPQTVNGWVTSFDPGPDEGGQSVLGYIVSNVSAPALFSAAPVVDAAGNLSYTPAADAFGSSTFDVAVQDDGGTPNGGSDTSPAQTFTITVNPVDDPPVAVGDSATVTEDDPATTIAVLANDTDIDGGPIGIASVTQPDNGTVVITSMGADLTYEPNPNYCNDGSPTDDFSYTLNGGSFATVAVTVTCVNDPPVVTFPTAAVNFDANVGPVNVDPGATFDDPDSPDLDTGNLVVDITTNCTAMDAIGIENQGTAPGQVGVSGADVTFGGTPIGTFVQDATCPPDSTPALRVDFNAAATPAAAEALLRAVQFSTTAGDTNPRTVDAIANDGDGGTSNTASQTANIDAAPTATSPADNDTNFDPTANITVDFSENVDLAMGAFALECDMATVAFTTTPAVPASGVNTVDLNPDTDLDPDAVCTLTVAAASVTDSDSIDPPDNMTADAVFGFVVEAAPEVTATTPTDSDTDVAADTNIVIDFSEPVTASAPSFDLDCPSAMNVMLTATANGSQNQYTLDPAVDLPAGETCTVTVMSTAISDVDSADPPDNLAGDFMFSFTIDAPPTVTQADIEENDAADTFITLPETGTAPTATDNADLAFVFSEGVTFNPGAFSVNCTTGGNVTGQYTAGTTPATNVTLTYGGAGLASGDTCTASLISDNIVDATGNLLDGNGDGAEDGSPADDESYDFVVDTAPSLTQVEVEVSGVYTAVSGPFPGGGVTDTDLDTTIRTTFDETVNDNGGTTVACGTSGSVSTGGGGLTVAGNGSTQLVLTRNTGAFQAGETCAITFNESGITDVDNADTPDNLTTPSPLEYEFELINAIAVADSFNVTRHLTARFDTTMPGTTNLLTNDTFGTGNVTAVNGVAANVGTQIMLGSGAFLTVQASGNFDYTSAPGASGAMDSFTYELDGADTATVTINVSGPVVWFVDADATGTIYTGTALHPFADLTGGNDYFAKPAAAGETVFVYDSMSNNSPLTCGVTLPNNLSIFGEGASVPLTTLVSTLTPVAETINQPDTTGNAPQFSSTGDCFTLGSTNTVRGLDVTDTTGGAAFVDGGATIGTATISEVGVRGAGSIVEFLNGGTLNASFTETSSTGSPSTKIHLVNINGTLDSMGGSMNHATAATDMMIVSGGNVGGSINASFNQTGGNAMLRIGTGHTGLFSFNVAMTANTGTGLQFNNADGTYNITNTVTIQNASAGINVDSGSDGTLSLLTGTLNASRIFATQGIPFRVNNSTMSIDYDGEIFHRAPALLSARTVEIIGGTGMISLDGQVIAGDVINRATGEVVFLSNTGSANPIRFNYVDAVIRDAPAFFSQISGNVAMDRLRVNCQGDLMLGGATHCVQVSDTASSGFTVEAMTVDLDDPGENGGALSLNNTPGVWTVEDISGGLLGLDETVVFGNTFGTLNIATVDSATSPFGPVTGAVAGANQPAFDLTNGTINIAASSVSAAPSGGGTLTTGIELVNTDGPGFTVTGDGSTAGSGGVLEDITGDAVRLQDTLSPVSFSYMTIQDIGDMGVADSEHDAIHGNSVNGGLVLDNVIIRRISDMAVHGAGFESGDIDTVWNGLTITNSTIQDTNRYHVPGAGDTSDEGAVRIRGLRGTVSITGNTFQDGAEHLDLFATAGTLNLTVTGNDFFESYKEFTSGGIASVGKMCVDLTVQGTANATVVIGDLVDTALGNNFRNCRIASVRIGNDSGATGTVTATTANNTFLVTDHSSGIGGDFDFPMGGVKYSTRGATTAVFDGRISDNTFTDVTNADGGVGNVTLDMDQGVIQVLVDNNTFHAPGNAAWFVRADATSSFNLEFDSNTYQRDAFPCTTDPSCGGGYFGPGLFNRTQAQNGAVLDVTYRNEGFAQHDTVFDPGNTVEVQVPNVGGGGTVCASFTGNSSPDGYALEESAGDLNLFNGLSALTGTCSAGAPGNCVTVLNDNSNTGGGGNAAADPPTVSVFGTIDIVSSACSLPSGGIF